MDAMPTPQWNGQPINKTFIYLGQNPSYENFIWFVKTFLKPHMITQFVEEDYYKILYEDMIKNRHALFQLPRGHSKTEFVGIWFTIFLACCEPYNPFFNKFKKPIKEQMLLAGDGQAKHNWTERIKHYFYECPYLRWLIPEGVDRRKQNTYWNDSVMYLRNGHKILLRAIGEKGIRGNHVDRLHADDLVTENSNVVDVKIKEKWDGAVDGVTTNKVAMVQVTGTPLRFSDILFHLKSRGYFFKRTPAIIDWEKQIILSPKRWSFEELIKTKERIGSVRFQCEYMLDPIDDSSSLIKGEWVRQCFNSDFDIIRARPDFVKAVYLGVDFAFSDRITADNSAFVIIGLIEKKEELVNQTRKVYLILDIITRKGMSVLEQFEFIKELHSSYHFDMIGLEDNSLKAVDKHIGAFNLPIKLFHTASSDSKGKKGEVAIFKRYETVGKRNLILRMGNMFEMKNIIVPTKSEEAKNKADQLFVECISFAQEEEKIVEIGVHPDIPIGLGYALEAAGRPNIMINRLEF